MGAAAGGEGMIRVVVAEDQGMVLGALVALLCLESDIEVIGRASDGAEAWALVQRLRPDVLIADIEMPQLTGLDVACRVRDAGLACRVLIVTTFARPGYLRRALDAGVTGYVLKDPNWGLPHGRHPVRSASANGTCSSWPNRAPATRKSR